MKKRLQLMLVVLFASVGSATFAASTDHSVENDAALGKSGGNGAGNGTYPDCLLLPSGK